MLMRFIQQNYAPSFLVAAVILLSGCDAREERAFLPVRLTDTQRIESITGPWDEEILPYLSDAIEEGTGFEWDGSDSWFPFHPITETRGVEIGPGVALKKIERDPENNTVVIPGRMGVARVVPVLPGAKILVECSGSFGPNELKAKVSFLSSYIPLVERPVSGYLRNILKEVGNGLIDLQPQEEKKSAGGILKMRADTRALLIMAYSFTERSNTLERVKLTYLRCPARRKDRVFADNFVVERDRENCVRPSLLLTPGTEIVYHEMRIPERCRFSGFMAHYHERRPGISFSLSAEDASGNRVPLVEWSGKKSDGKWEEIEADLGFLSGRRIKLRVTATADAESPVGQDGPPTVYLGSPMLVAPLSAGKKPAGKRPGYNVILVSLDTLRQDHLGCYGYDKPVSPRIDALARESALFTRAYSTAPYTLPSHASLFTALYPSVHGIRDRNSGVIPPQAKLLAEALAERGWITGSFNGGGYVSHDFGFHRGFDLYCEVDPLGDRYLNHYVMHEEQVFADGSTGSFDRALAWIESVSDQRFYLFLHTFMIHDFQPPDSYAKEFADTLPPSLSPSKKTYDGIKVRYRENGTVTDEERRYIVGMYDAGIRASDDMIGELLTRIDRLGIEDETMVIVLSDHGEEFLDHGALNHNRTLYQELIHVPLIVHVPGKGGGRIIDRPVSLVDVMPTVLELVGVGMEGGHGNGRSLLGDLRGDSGKEDLIFAEVDVPGFSKRSCVIEKGWKLIEGSTDPALMYPAPEEIQLFDLTKDPREQVGRRATSPEKEKRLERLLRGAKDDALKRREALGIDKQESLPLDPALLEVLKQQGYI